MEDKLKTLAQMRRREADELKAPDFLWERIATELDKKQKGDNQPLMRRLWIKPPLRVAAAVVALLAAGIFALKRWPPDESAQPNAWANYPELQQAEAYFQPMIIAKVRRLEQIGDKALTAALLQDLALLEKDYETLAKDLHDNADNQQLIRAMVENYRSRLQLLERMLKEIEQKQTHDKPHIQS